MKKERSERPVDACRRSALGRRALARWRFMAERWGRPRTAPLLGLACLVALLVAGCALSAPTPSSEETSGKPNFLFVLADDLDLASIEEMPAITSLIAEEGVTFENAFISYPACCPSRASMLTGQYAHNHNVRGNKNPAGGFEKFRDEGNEEGTIAVGLQGAGYRTALFGKYLNHYPDKGDPTHVPPGWDEWYAKTGPHEYYDYELNENGEVVSYGSEEEDYLTDVLSGHTTDFVRRATAEDQPFFAYVAPIAPHGPSTPAERHKGVFEGEEAPRPPAFGEEDVSDKPSPVREISSFTEKDNARIDEHYRERQESMLAVDEMIGTLVEELEAAGELENTYIVFTSDNGYHLGQHRMKRGKKTPYEEAVHVPLFIRGPGVQADSMVEDLVLNTDLAPTFAELGGADLEGTDGRSVAPLLRGEAPPWRSSLLLEAFLDGKNAREGSDGEEGSRMDQTAFRAVRTETHKYVEHDNGERELYDLVNDPYELENVYEGADPALLEDLTARLEAMRGCEGDGCRKAEDAP